MPILERIALVGAREAARKAKIPIKFADVTTSFDKVRLESLQVELGKLINGISFAQMDTIEKLIQASIMHGIEPKNIAKLVDLAITAPDAGVLALGQKIEQLPPGSTNWQTIQETLEMSLTKQASKQAMTIARTETMRAANTGQATFWNEAKKDGLLTKDAKVVYIVTPDDRLCEDICEPMTGKTRSMDGHFKLPDGEQIKSPPAHPNCRCTTGIVRS